MAKGFKVTTKYHTHDPEKAKNLISGSGLLQAIKDSVDALHKKIEHPFNLLEGSDFNGQDPTVNHFNSLGGPVRVIKIMSGNNPMNHLKIYLTIYQLLDCQNIEKLLDMLTFL